MQPIRLDQGDPGQGARVPANGLKTDAGEQAKSRKLPTIGTVLDLLPLTHGPDTYRVLWQTVNAPTTFG